MSFNRHELNDIYECSDVESMQQEAAIDPEDNCGKSTNSEDDDSDDILELGKFQYRLTFRITNDI